MCGFGSASFFLIINITFILGQCVRERQKKERARALTCVSVWESLNVLQNSCYGYTC